MLGESLKRHPDKVPEAEKVYATEDFKRLSNACKLLRLKLSI